MFLPCNISYVFKASLIANETNHYTFSLLRNSKYENIYFTLLYFTIFNSRYFLRLQPQFYYRVLYTDYNELTTFNTIFYSKRHICFKTGRSLANYRASLVIHYVHTDVGSVMTHDRASCKSSAMFLFYNPSAVC